MKDEPLTFQKQTQKHKPHLQGLSTGAVTDVWRSYSFRFDETIELVVFYCIFLVFYCVLSFFLSYCIVFYLILLCRIVLYFMFCIVIFSSCVFFFKS